MPFIWHLHIVPPANSTLYCAGTSQADRKVAQHGQRVHSKRYWHIGEAAEAVEAAGSSYKIRRLKTVFLTSTGTHGTQKSTHPQTHTQTWTQYHLSKHTQNYTYTFSCVPHADLHTRTVMKEVKWCLNIYIICEMEPQRSACWARISEQLAAPLTRDVTSFPLTPRGEEERMYTRLQWTSPMGVCVCVCVCVRYFHNNL